MLNEEQAKRVLEAAGWSELRAGAWAHRSGLVVPSLEAARIACARMLDAEGGGGAGASPGPLFDQSADLFGGEG